MDGLWRWNLLHALGGSKQGDWLRCRWWPQGLENHDSSTRAILWTKEAFTSACKVTRPGWPEMRERGMAVLCERQKGLIMFCMFRWKGCRSSLSQTNDGSQRELREFGPYVKMINGGKIFYCKSLFGKWWWGALLQVYNCVIKEFYFILLHIQRLARTDSVLCSMAVKVWDTLETYSWDKSIICSTPPRCLCSLKG